MIGMRQQMGAILWREGIVTALPGDERIITGTRGREVKLRLPRPGKHHRGERTEPDRLDGQLSRGAVPLPAMQAVQDSARPCGLCG